jgi:hypothetical protein
MRSVVRRSMLGALALTLSLALAPSCVLVAEEGAAVELGVRVEAPLAEGWLHVEDVRLVRCPGSDEQPAHALAWGPARAAALHPGAIDRLGEPHLVALHEPGAVLGRLHPGPGRYCAVEVFVTPTAELDGWTLTGRGVAADGSAFDLRGHGMRVWRLPLLQPMGLHDEPAEVRTVELTLSPERALDGVDPATDHAGLDLLLALEATAGAEAR